MEVRSYVRWATIYGRQETLPVHRGKKKSKKKEEEKIQSRQRVVVFLHNHTTSPQVALQMGGYYLSWRIIWNNDGYRRKTLIKIKYNRNKLPVNGWGAGVTGDGGRGAGGTGGIYSSNSPIVMSQGKLSGTGFPYQRSGRFNQREKGKRGKNSSACESRAWVV